ncbi:MAG TPA: PilZ domain-containing protein [Planctomycetes bacterium]|nr:PilZ domain-containing protein [Planctomycetota bacterium]
MAAGNKKCTVCGRSYPAGRDFRTVNLPGQFVGYVCRNCAPKITESEGLFTAVSAGDWSTDERRRHTRKPAHLLLTFTHVRGNAVYPGIVRDISQGGIRFSTKARVSPGELLNLNVFSPLTGLHVKAVAKVKWLRERETYNDAGVEFTAEGRHLRMDDRRSHHRVLAEFVLHWHNRGKPVEGRVKDISQGGIRFTAAEPLPEGRRVSVTLHATGLEVVRAEGGFPLTVEKTIVVVGVRKSEERYEIRARFAAENESR